jgi:ornithine cyclodeaminase/alanine dehydrogenase
MHQDLLYLSRADVEAAGLEISTIIELLASAFFEKGKGQVEMPPKPGIHPQPDAFIHAMPAYIPGLRSAGIKWVGGYPENKQHGLPYISGLLILNDPRQPGCWDPGMRCAGAHKPGGAGGTL